METKKLKKKKVQEDGEKEKKNNKHTQAVMWTKGLKK